MHKNIFPVMLGAGLVTAALAMPAAADAPLVIREGNPPPTTQPNAAGVDGPVTTTVIVTGGAVVAQPGARQVPGGMFVPLDPERIRQASQNEIKTALNATDDEWKTLQPKIEAVQKLLPAQSPFMRPIAAPPVVNGGGPVAHPGVIVAGRLDNGPGAAQPEAPAAVKLAELRAAVDDQASTPDQIKAKVAALRDARNKAKEELAKAQKDLREGLAPRQEAILISRGLLE